ncbi:MAG TPA: NAD-dependent epimerase/dehydratase family protein [Longimicrobium sp.]|nr:NAD-dependent epimerase/dehydratase family protein [Longimicrobium sp.]
MSARRILVTGGAGFIGSHVARAYLERGWAVTVLDSLVHGRRENLPEGVEFVHADVRDEAAARLVLDGGFDVVSHHAAQMDVRVSVQDPRFDAAVNVDGLLNLLEASRQAGVGRFVYVSSGGVVYGTPETRPTPETAPKLPESPYGVSKLAGEQYLFYYHRVHGMEYVALRYANVYGPRQDPHGEAGVVAIFSTRLLEGRPLTVFGDGAQTRDYVYVGDVVAANLAAGEAELPPARTLDDRAFNVGTGTETSVAELAHALSRVAGVEPRVEHGPARAGELRHSSLDTSRLRALGWAPRTGLDEGLRATYAWIAADAGRAG